MIAADSARAGNPVEGAACPWHQRAFRFARRSGVAPYHQLASAHISVRSEAIPPAQKAAAGATGSGLITGAPRGSSMPLGEKNMDAASSTAPSADMERA